jgi:hypothetical protein
MTELALTHLSVVMCTLRVPAISIALFGVGAGVWHA